MTAYMDHKDLANEVIDQARAQEITDGVHRVLDRIASAESAAGRAAGSVQLLAATKTRDVGEILAAIEELSKGHTVISIAHRLSTVRKADQILVIDDGKLVQEGKHSDLINMDGIYSMFIKARERAANWKL